MALLSSTSSSSAPLLHNFIKTPSKSPNLTSPSLCRSSAPVLTTRTQPTFPRTRIRSSSTVSCLLCTDEALALDRSVVKVGEAYSDAELCATSRLRVRTFFVSQQQPHDIQDHMKYLAERDYEALKERIAGEREEFKRVSCINATVPLSSVSNYSDELCSLYKYSENGEDRVVIGSLDLNQCLRIPDEIIGKRPEGVGSDLPRAYLSNVCVAKELQNNGVGSSLVFLSKKVARNWGITDLYVHVAVDNEPARRLYIKSGFIYESDEPAWQARFLDRPRRILLWSDVSDNSNL